MMVETANRTREIGRPRTFSDEAIYAATAKVLTRTGNEHLTLSLIADEVGCSPPALVQRFGSKRALLQNYVSWGTAALRQRFEEVSSRSDISPLQKIYELASLPRSKRPHEITEKEGLPTSVFFHLAAWNDESFRPLVEERVELFETTLQSLLEQATQANELRGGDERELSRTLVTTFSGVALQAISLKREPIEQRLTQVIEIILRPYLVSA